MMIRNNIRTAWRNLLRRRTFTIINVAGLGLGMTAAIFAFLWVRNEFSFDRFHRHADRICRINSDIKISSDETWHWCTTPLPLDEALRSEVPEVVRTALLFENSWQPLALKKNAVMVAAKHNVYVSDDWFDLFDYQFVSGSASGFEQHLQSAIITRDLAEKLFGRWDVAGENFQIDTTEFLVQAVIENHRPNSSFTHDIIRPLKTYLSDPAVRENEHWDNFNFLTFAELRPGVDEAALNEKLTELIWRYKDSKDVSLNVQPLSQVHFDEERSSAAMLTGSRKTADTFGLIGLIILFLACVNYVSITTAQAGMRTKEVGVRKIIGAAGHHVFRLLFAESLLTVLLALALSLCLVHFTMPAFNGFTEKNFALSSADPAVWLVVGGTAALALLLSGVYPALFLTGFSPGNFLRGRNFLNVKNTVFRKGLVVVQFAVTAGLIISATVILQQQDFIRKKDLGYDRSQRFEFQISYNDRREEMVKMIQQKLAAAPGVAGTAAANSSIIDMNSTHSGSLDWDGRPADFVPTVSQLSIGPGFGEVLQLPLKEGRWFEPGNEADQRNVILNETAVRLFHLPEPVVGQRFSFHGREGQVVGVVRDFHFQSLRNKIGPLVLFDHPKSIGNIIVKTGEGQAAEAIAAARDAWSAFNPGQPFEYHFLDETFDRLYRNEEKSAALFRVLAALAVFISCLGLFGLAVFSTERRTKEIGVRKVMGAGLAGLISLLTRDFLKLVLIALVIAVPVAWFLMSRWLQDFAYRIDIRWWVFALAGFLVLATAFLTVGFQSLKAALANPVGSLRNE